MDDISQNQYEKYYEKQYRHLIKCFRDILLHPILGDDYYNMGMDAYTCNKFSCEDLKYKYDRLKNAKRIYKILFIIMLIIAILLAIFK